MTAKRKHVATGKSRGGTRKGAGRPEGSFNSLGLGEVKAMGVANLRLPPDATPGQAQIAELGLGRIVDVMLERVSHFQAGNVLKAATRIREEVCGPLTQKVVVSGLETLTDEQLEARLKAISAKVADVPTEPLE